MHLLLIWKPRSWVESLVLWRQKWSFATLETGRWLLISRQNPLTSEETREFGMRMQESNLSPYSPGTGYLQLTLTIERSVATCVAAGEIRGQVRPPMHPPSILEDYRLTQLLPSDPTVCTERSQNAAYHRNLLKRAVLWSPLFRHVARACLRQADNTFTVTADVHKRFPGIKMTFTSTFLDASFF